MAKSNGFGESVYTATRQWPREETYGLINQVYRAAVSIPSNIAEGQGRRSAREFVHFLKIAIGSLFEVEAQLMIAHRLQYIDAASLEPLLQLSDEIGRIISGLINSFHFKDTD